MRYARIIYVIIMRRTFYEAAICVCRQGRTVDANSRGEGAPEPDTLDSQRTFDLLDSVVIEIRQSLQLVRPVTVERDTLNQIITCETQHGPFSRSEEHTSELQSLMRISYAVFCLKKN